MKPIFDITAFGARGDGRTVNTLACQRAATACRESGGGTILVPPGDFLTGRVEIFSDTVVHVEEGGCLIAAPCRGGDPFGGVFHAADAENIVFRGGGIVDGNADEMRRGDLALSNLRRRKRGVLPPEGHREDTLAFTRCGNLEIEGLTITGAISRAILCEDCERVTVRNVSFSNRVTCPNSDGLHFNACRGVLVEACSFVGGESATAILGRGTPAGPAEIVLGFREITLAGEAIRIHGCHLSPLPPGGGTVGREALLLAGRQRGSAVWQPDVDDVTLEQCKADPSLFRGNWWGRGEPIPISTAMRSGI